MSNTFFMGPPPGPIIEGMSAGDEADRRLAELLVEQGVVVREQVERALAELARRRAAGRCIKRRPWRASVGARMAR